MKLGQLIEYNTGNNFLEKLHTKCGRETILRTFIQISAYLIKHISDLWIVEILKFVFLL